MLTVTLKWAKTNFLFKIFKGCTWNKICVFSLFKSKNIRETWRKVSANFQKNASVIFWKWKLCRLCSARMQPKLSIFLIRPPKNIPDQQKCVGFHKLKKVLNHSTLLPEYYSYSMMIYFRARGQQERKEFPNFLSFSLFLFLSFLASLSLLCIFFLSFWNTKGRMGDHSIESKRKEDRWNQKKGELHELPHRDRVKSETIRLA